jgi:hypothetical protein
MRPLAWTTSVPIALQLSLSAAAPHPFGAPLKKAVPLFAPRLVLPQVNTGLKSKIVCGTLVVEADPRTDPKMTTEPRTDITFSSRTYPRPGCGKQK